jgi:hypothetical protein
LRHLMCEREQGEMETCIRFFLRQWWLCEFAREFLFFKIFIF